ncbi:Hypothetical predicted protein, partial [Pelobates cultripes]
MQPGTYQRYNKMLDAPYLTLGSVVESDSIRTLASLVGPEASYTLQVFCYAQLTHFLMANASLLRGPRTLSDFETHCLTHNIKTKQLSTFYKILQDEN